MGTAKTTKYDTVDYLKTYEDMAAYLEACLEIAEGDDAFIAKAMSDIERAKRKIMAAEAALLSEKSLSKDWRHEEEEQAWQHLET